MIPNIPNPIHESLLKDFRDACPQPTCPKCGKEMSYNDGSVVFCEEDDVVVDVTVKNYLIAVRDSENTIESVFGFSEDLSSVMKKWAIRDFGGIIDFMVGFTPNSPYDGWTTFRLNVVGVLKQSM